MKILVSSLAICIQELIGSHTVTCNKKTLTVSNLMLGMRNINLDRNPSHFTTIIIVVENVVPVVTNEWTAIPSNAELQCHNSSSVNTTVGMCQQVLIITIILLMRQK